MIVTINTDASYHSEHKVGAFAFWIVSDMGKIMQSGPLKSDEIKSATEAELQCILNALFVLGQQEWKSTITKIIINTDSLNSIHILTGDTNAMHKYNLRHYKAYRGKYAKILRKGELRKVNIEFRHVKAHSNAKDARSWVNNWCDEQAKKHLWNAINHGVKKNLENNTEKCCLVS